MSEERERERSFSRVVNIDHTPIKILEAKRHDVETGRRSKHESVTERIPLYTHTTFFFFFLLGKLSQSLRTGICGRLPECVFSTLSLSGHVSRSVRYKNDDAWASFCQRMKIGFEDIESALRTQVEGDD